MEEEVEEIRRSTFWQCEESDLKEDAAKLIYLNTQCSLL